MSETNSGLTPEELGIEDFPEQVEGGTIRWSEDVDRRVRGYFGSEVDFPAMASALKNYEGVESLEGQATLRHVKPNDAVALEGVAPVLFAPGWTEDHVTVVEEAYGMAQQGYEVLIPGHARRGKAEEAPTELGLEKRGVDLTAAGFQRALNILNGLERSEVEEEVSVVAHSEGATDALVAALIAPERFKGGIVLVNPSMVEGENLLSLAIRFAPQLAKNRLQQNIRGTGHIAANPIRAASEAVSLGNTDLWQLAQDVRALGVPLTMVLGERDTVYSPQRVLPRLERVRHEGGVDGPESDGQYPFDLVTTMDWHHNTMHEEGSEAVALYDEHLRAMRRSGQESVGDEDYSSQSAPEDQLTAD